VFTEEDWTDPDKLDAYGKSKTLAEKAAWDYVKELPGKTGSMGLYKRTSR
jgi:nucleoside-diphosphate-sugar epimerase